MEGIGTEPDGRGPRLRPGSALVALAGLVVFAVLSPPVSGMGDSSEFTLVLATNGVAHPTGYPLYTLFGHLFCAALHACGISWQLAGGWWSAVGGAVALYFVHALGMELAAPVAAGAAPFLAALLPAVLFAFEPLALHESSVAEINIWSVAWGCGAAYAFVRLSARLRAPASSRSDLRSAAWWGLLCGVGLAHHLTSVLISVPLSVALLLILAVRGRLTPRLPLAAVAAALLPIASYGIIAWHAWHPARVQWAYLDSGFGSVWEHITGAQYHQYLGAFDPAKPQRMLLREIVFPFLFPGLLLLLLGLARAKDTDSRLAWSALLAACVLVTFFTLGYGVTDPAAYLLPAMALGSAAAAPAILAIPGARSRAGAFAIGAACLAALFLVVPWLRGGVEDRMDTIQFENKLRSMWSSIPSEPAIVSWTDDRVHRLIEYQVLRGEKPAVLVIAPDGLFAPSIRRAVIKRFGADPLEGFDYDPVDPTTAEGKATIQEYRDRLLSNLNRRIRAPLIYFDPAVPIVWQYPKPWETARGGGGRTP